MPVADVFAAGTGLLDFGRQSLYGPQREVLEEATPDTIPTGSPEVPDYFIERPRLTRLLDEATAPVIMLIAPAGFGKTTLARQWLAPRRRGWYRGSPAAADVAALAVGLARSAGSIVPDAGRRMGERLRATGTPEQDVEPLAELLAEDLADWPDDAWLAFDDYQFASESPFAEEFVERVLALCPLKLFLTSRKRPSWATSRRLLYGDMYEIGRSLLAMSQEEAEEVLADRRGSEASGLVALADGWPAVIGLAALTDEIELPDEGVPEALYAYFAEELYQAADPELRWSLSQLSLSSTVAPAVARSRARGRGRARVARWTPARLPRAVGARRRRDPSTASRLSRGEVPRAGRRSLVRDRRARRANAPRAGGVGRRLLDRRALLRRGAARRGRRDSAAAGLAGGAIADPCALGRVRRPARGRCAGVRPCRGRTRVSCRRPHPFGGTRPPGSAAIRGRPRSRVEILRPRRRQRPPVEQGDHRARVTSVAPKMSPCTPADRRQAVWGRFLSMTALEREDGAAQALKELEDTQRHIGRRSASCRQWPTDAWRHSEATSAQSVDEMTVTAPLVEKATDPMIQSSALNAYAATLVLLGRYSEAHSWRRRSSS